MVRFEKIFCVLIALTSPAMCLAQTPQSTKAIAHKTNQDSPFVISNSAKLSGRLALSALVSGQERIYSVDLDYGESRPLVDGPGNNSYPEWSSDGGQLAFVSDRSGTKKIYIAKWDGTNQKQLSNSGFEEDHPSWSNSGRQIVHSVNLKEDGKEATRLHVYDIEKATASVIEELPGRNLTPQFFREDQNLIYVTNRSWPGWDICLFSFSRRKEQCLLTGPLNYARPHPSHDNNWLLYSIGTGRESHLGLYKFEGAEQFDLTRRANREYEAIWSADDKNIIILAEDKDLGINNAYALNFDTKEISTLITTKFSIRHISWTSKKTIELEASRMRELEAERTAIHEKIQGK